MGVISILSERICRIVQTSVLVKWIIFKITKNNLRNKSNLYVILDYCNRKTNRLSRDLVSVVPLKESKNSSQSRRPKLNFLWKTNKIIWKKLLPFPFENMKLIQQFEIAIKYENNYKSNEYGAFFTFFSENIWGEGVGSN